MSYLVPKKISQEVIGLHITDTNMGDYKKKCIEELKQMSFERELYIPLIIQDPAVYSGSNKS